MSDLTDDQVRAIRDSTFGSDDKSAQIAVLCDEVLRRQEQLGSALSVLGNAVRQRDEAEARAKANGDALRPVMQARVDALNERDEMASALREAVALLRGDSGLTKAGNRAEIANFLAKHGWKP